MNILLCCAFGASSSFFVAKTKAYIESKNYDINFFADSVTEISYLLDAKKIDVILLAPGVVGRRPMIERLTAKKNIVVEAISTVDYGRINCEKVIEDLIQNHHLDVTKK